MRRLLFSMLAIAVVGASGLLTQPDATAVYGGSEVSWSDHSEIAHLQGKSGAEWTDWCGGTFLTDNWVLTAAHCVTEDKYYKDWLLDQVFGSAADQYAFANAAGTTSVETTPVDAADLRVISASGTKSDVAEIRVHPAFSYVVKVGNPGFHWTAPFECWDKCAKVEGLDHLVYDTALIRLSVPATGVRHVELLDDAAQLTPGLSLTAYGWGDQDPSSTWNPSDALKVTPAKSLELTDPVYYPACLPSGGSSKFPSVLCAGSDSAQTGAGKGDSGGPWYATLADGSIRQLGITSFAPKTGWQTSHDPARISSVPASIRWIRSVTGLTSATAASADNIATALVIDNSGSMSSNDTNMLRRDASITYVNTAVPGDHVGVVGFESSAYEISPMQQLPDGKASLTQALNTSIRAGGGTNIGAGLTSACSMLDSPNLPARRAAILMTDGDGGYINEASCFASRGWHVFTVGLGSSVNTSLLKSIAQQTGGTYQPVPTASKLQCTFQQVRTLVAGGNPTPCDSDVISLNEVITKTVTVAARMSQVTFSSNWPGSDVEMTLVSPSGRHITRQTNAWDVVHSLAATHEEYVVTVPEPGTWTVKLHGVDVADQGEEVIFSSGSVPFDNQLPILSATVSPTADRATWSFAAEATDPDGTIDHITWDFGDGFGAEDEQTTHTYATAGTYNPTVTAVDDAGEVTTKQLPAVTVAAPEVKTVAQFTTTADGLTIKVDASTSSAQSSFAKYVWDFNGDGEVDRESASPTASWTYTQPGEYQVSLGVVPISGQAASTTQTVTVLGYSAGLFIDYGAKPLKLAIPVKISIAPDGVIYRVIAVGKDGKASSALTLDNPYRGSKGNCLVTKKLCKDKLVGLLSFNDPDSGVRFVGATENVAANKASVSGNASGVATTSKLRNPKKITVRFTARS